VNWAVAVVIAAIIGGLLLYVFQECVERGEDDCRAKCAASGGYRYSPPGRTSAETCTCVKDR
jgi:hypothetical protein